MKTDLLIVLKKMSSKEVKGFNAYLKKQLKADSLPLKLFDYLRKHHPQFDPRKVNYEKAYTYVNPDKAFNKVTIANGLSDINLHLQNYLIEQHLNRSDFQKEWMMLQVYRAYQIDHLFEKQLNKLNRILSKTTQKDCWYFLKAMQLKHEQYFYMGAKRVGSRESLYDAMEQLDQFHTATKLRYSSEIYNGVQILGEPIPNIRFLPEIEQSDWEGNSDYHHFYRLVLQLFKDLTDSNYHILKTFFLEKHALISSRDQFIIITYLLNYTSYAIKKGKDHFVNESFELIQFGVKQLLFIIDGIFDANHFLNAVETAGRLGQFDWARNFITNWNEKLAPQTRDYYTDLGRALLYFKTKNYHQCSDILSRNDMKEPQDKYRGRWLRLISLYEIDYPTNHTFVMGECEAFRQYIKRNQLINKEAKDGVLLAIKVLKMLLKTPPEKDKLLEVLNSGKSFYYKSWLEQKIKAL